MVNSLLLSSMQVSHFKAEMFNWFIYVKPNNPIMFCCMFLQAAEDLLLYSKTIFTRGKAGRSLRRADVEEESISSGVRVLG